MIKKIKAFIAVGGTGGHVFPGCNLAEFLIQKNYEIKIKKDLSQLIANKFIQRMILLNDN